MEVAKNCKLPLGKESRCKKCLNAGFGYLHHLGIADNITLSTCRDATFVALASQVNEISTIDIASCFFGVQGLLRPPGNDSFKSKVLTGIGCDMILFISLIICMGIIVM